MSGKTFVQNSIEVAFYASKWALHYKDYATWKKNCDQEIVWDFERAIIVAVEYAIGAVEDEEKREYFEDREVTW